MVKTTKIENGHTICYEDDKIHCEDGPAVIYSDGTQQWWLNNELHREDGPAVILPDGTQEWWLNDKVHREDGPAIIYPDGSYEWCFKDYIMSFELWCDEVNISDEKRALLKLEYA